jgi:methylated-DNA-[protein]-cysteine S-methyltransferase
MAQSYSPVSRLEFSLAETIMTEESEGIYIEPLGLHFIVERRRDRISGARLSREEPDRPLTGGWKEAILRCWPGGETVPWDLLDLSGLTKFQREVLSFVASIPLGETLTYGQVAEGLGRPKAARAVGSALGKNPFSLIIPCHRVVGSKGIGGYSSGVELKRKVLDVEKEICQK